MSAPVRTIPTLPTLLDGSAVTWSAWSLAAWMTHVDNGCDICDHPGPMSVAGGRSADRRRYTAVRCRRCQRTRVVTFVADRWIEVRPGTNTPRRFGEHVVVWESPAQAIGAEL